MIWLYITIVAVIGLQVYLFILGRRIRRKEKENNILLKYDINTRQRAWQLLADPTIPDDDKVKIREVYDQENE